MIDYKAEAEKIALWQDASSNPDRTNIVNAIIALCRRVDEEATERAAQILGEARTGERDNDLRSLQYAIRTRKEEGR